MPPSGSRCPAEPGDSDAPTGGFACLPGQRLPLFPAGSAARVPGRAPRLAPEVGWPTGRVRPERGSGPDARPPTDAKVF